MRFPHILFAFALAAAAFLPSGSSRAQSTSAATPTPTPIISSLPAPDCNTGADFNGNNPPDNPPGFPPGVPFGISGGNYKSINKTSCCTGTFGALVQDSDENQFVLSCNHVLARTSSTTRTAAANEMIVQPGLLDLGCFQDPADGVAKLSRWVPLNFGGANTVDAAIAEVDSSLGPTVGMNQTGWIMNVGPVEGQLSYGSTISSIPFPVSNLYVGMPVQKMGRTTCLTGGQIDAFDAMGKVSYEKGCGALNSGTAKFDHQILVLGSLGTSAPDPNLDQAFTFAAPGDSGSLVLTFPSDPSVCPYPQAVGLLFAGSGTLTAVNPIEQVLTALKVTLVGNECAGSGASAASSDLSALAGAPSAAFRNSVARVRAVQERHANHLLGIEEVTAIGIGRGASPGQAGLVIYVTKDTLQVRAKLPTQIDGVPVRIVQSGEFHAL